MPMINHRLLVRSVPAIHCAEKQTDRKEQRYSLVVPKNTFKISGHKQGVQDKIKRDDTN